MNHFSASKLQLSGKLVKREINHNLICIDCTDLISLKMKKPANYIIRRFLLFLMKVLVGAAGFEPTTSWSQTRRDTGLRYAPKLD